jgi:hypothetical protein
MSNPTEPGKDPQPYRALIVLGQVSAAVMVLSLVLPWVEFFFGASGCYLNVLFEIVAVLTKEPKVLKSLMFSEVLSLLAFVGPALATLVAGWAAIAGLSPQASPHHIGDGLVAGGLLGLLAAGGLYWALRYVDPLIGVCFGTGYYLFALAALVLLVTGGRIPPKPPERG